MTRDEKISWLSKFFVCSSFSPSVDDITKAIQIFEELIIDLNNKEDIIKDLLDSLECVRINDKTVYEYGEVRKLDEKKPGPGQRWSTPFEISREAIENYTKKIFKIK